MLYEIAKEVQTALEAKGVPHRVVYGPERAPTQVTNARIVIERDRETGDVWNAPRSRTANPKMLGVRSVGAIVRIFAKSSKAGAGVHEHEREADILADQIAVALHKVIRARNTLYSVQRAGLLSAQAAQMQGLESWPGAIYEVRLSIDRGVYDTTWAGASKSTATMGGAHGVSIGHTLTVGGDAVATDSLPNATTEFADGS
jgi:hypothetical protein